MFLYLLGIINTIVFTILALVGITLMIINKDKKYLIKTLMAFTLVAVGNLIYYLTKNETIYGIIMTSPYYMLLIYIFYSLIKYKTLILPDF
jgi:hypothetical protein